MSDGLVLKVGLLSGSEFVFLDDFESGFSLEDVEVAWFVYGLKRHLELSGVL